MPPKTENSGPVELPSAPARLRALNASMPSARTRSRATDRMRSAV